MAGADTEALARDLAAAVIAHRMGISPRSATRRLAGRRPGEYWMDLARKIERELVNGVSTASTAAKETQERWSLQ